MILNKEESDKLLKDIMNKNLLKKKYLKQGTLKELKKLLKQINRDLKEIKYELDVEFDSQITSFDVEIPKLIYQEKYKLLFWYKQNTIKRIKELEGKK